MAAQSLSNNNNSTRMLTKDRKKHQHQGGFSSYGRAHLERGGDRILPSYSNDPIDVAVQQRTDRGSSSNDISPKLKSSKGGRKKEVDMGISSSVVGQLHKWKVNLPTKREKHASTNSSSSGEKKKRSDSVIDVDDDEDDIIGALVTSNCYVDKPKKVVELPSLGNSRKTGKRFKSHRGNRKQPGNIKDDNEIMAVLDSVSDGWFHKYEATQEAVRIAIGKKVIRAKCSLSFCFSLKDQFILFSFEEEVGRMCEMRVYLKRLDLKEMKFHIANDSEYVEGGYIGCPMSVIAFRITPTSLNGFDRFADFYDKEETDESNDKGGRYITLEFQDTDDFREMLDKIRQHPDLAAWCAEESEVEYDNLGHYTKVLIQDTLFEETKEAAAIENMARKVLVEELTSKYEVPKHL